MAKRTVIQFEVESDLRDRCIVAAALSGTTLKQWAIDALTEKLKRGGSIKISPGFIVLNEPEGSLEDTLKLVEKLSPKIKSGIRKSTDPVEDIELLRSERMDDLGG